MKNGIGTIFGTGIAFLRDVRSELKKTSFPSRQLTIQNTVIVIVFSLGVAAFLGGLDMLFSYLLAQYIF
ncbi:MAG: preprotein translocase subunit SecE [Candidatus Azambacteria bacterium]|nr:preprotein translocase subunit SecE [Candidatus Azambacteria bacterium]